MPQPNWRGFSKGLGSIQENYLRPMAEREQAARTRQADYKMDIQKAIELQRIKQEQQQADPFSRLMEMGKMGDALQKSGMTFEDLGVNQQQVLGYIKGGQEVGQGMGQGIGTELPPGQYPRPSTRSVSAPRYGQGRGGIPTYTPTEAEMSGGAKPIAPVMTTPNIPQSPIAPRFNQFNKQDDTLIPGKLKETRFGKLKPEGYDSAEAIGARQVIPQEAKQSAKLERELKTSHTKMNTMFGSFLDTVNRTFELTGVKPGPLQAPLTKILGASKINEFKEAFTGAQPEYAAAIGRMAVPGARSVRLIDLFKKGAPSEWSTIPSGINNSAKSARMALAGYIATEEGSQALGVPYDPLNPMVWNNAANAALNKFEEAFKEGLYEMVFMKNPDLLDDATRERLTQEFIEQTGGM